MGVYEKLCEIQNSIKCAKSQYNSFGKYKYRSLEDIFEAVKPITSKLRAVVMVSDEICHIEGRFYIKSTAKLICAESGEEIKVTAYAREDDSKKGMDGSQLTGCASSYARKYALGGLLALDDTKDSDFPMPEEVERATANQLKLVKALVKDERAVCEYYKVKSIENLTKDMANEIIKKKGGANE